MTEEQITGGQLILDFPVRPALDRDDFWVASCNARAVDWVERWPDWPALGLALCGPPASGKSHLLAVWRALASALSLSPEHIEQVTSGGLPSDVRTVAVDDAHLVAASRSREAGLFHLINILDERKGSLLLAAPTPPSRWPVLLPDLVSRLKIFPVQSLTLPDDDLLAALLIKHFSDRQLKVGAHIVSFLLARMERSFAAAHMIAERLDTMSLSENRVISVSLARRVLSHMEAVPTRKAPSSQTHAGGTDASGESQSA